MKQHKGPLSFISELDSIIEEGVSGSGPHDQSSSLVKKQSDMIMSSGKQSCYLESYQNSKRSEYSVHSKVSKKVKEEVKKCPET